MARDDGAHVQDPTSEVPTVTVATGWSRGPLPLGLDRPFELRGADRLDVHGVGSTLPFDRLPELLAIVVEECAARAAAGRRWFGLPPLALIGPRGSGRTHLARQLARHAGLPLVLLDLAGEEGLRRLRRDGAPPEVDLPSDLVLAMCAAGCANPVVLVTGLAEADGEALGLLAAMVDPRSGRRWTEEGLSASVDLTHVTWLVAAEEISALPRRLAAALRPIGVALPKRGNDGRATNDQELMLLGLLDELLADLGRPGPVGAETYRGFLEQVAQGWTWHGLAELRAKLGAVLTAERT